MSEWRPGDREAIRRALALPATLPCLDAIDLAMAGLARHHSQGVLTALPLLDAVAQIDQLLLVPGTELEQAIEKQSRSGLGQLFSRRSLQEMLMAAVRYNQSPEVKARLEQWRSATTSDGRAEHDPALGLPGRW